MDDKALFVRFTADAGHEGDVADFLREALGPVEAEPDTRDWYAIRFTPTDYAVVDTFPGNLGRLKHLFGKVGRALPVKTFTILDGPPGIHPADVLASKPLAKGATPRLALHVPLEARAGQEEVVERFLIDAQPLIAAEAGTLAWYALKLGSNSFAIVDVFADETARAAHMSGSVAGAMMARAAELFEETPVIRHGDVLACKAGAQSAVL